MRVSFDQVFQTNPDGSISPRGPVHIGGVTMGGGVSFGGGVSIGGMNVADMKGKDLEIEKQADVIVIKGYYR